MIRQFVFALFATTSIVSFGKAETITWKGWQGSTGLANPTIGSYFDGLHWENFLPPEPSDQAIFDTNLLENLEPTYIYFGDFDKRATPNNFHEPGGNAIASALRIRNGQWTFNFNAFDDPDLFGVDQDTGSLSINDAEIDGELDLAGNGFLSADSLLIGASATAKLSLNGGAEIRSFSCDVGVGHDATINLSGSGTSLDIVSLELGDGGAGRLRVSNGAYAEILSLSLATSENSVGEVIASGSGSFVQIESGVSTSGFAGNVARLRAELGGHINFPIFAVLSDGVELEAVSDGLITVGYVTEPISNAVTVGEDGYFVGSSTIADVVVQEWGVLALEGYSESRVHEVVGDVSILSGGILSTHISADLDDPEAFYSSELVVEGHTQIDGIFNLSIPTDDDGVPEIELSIGDRFTVITSSEGVEGRFAEAQVPLALPGSAYKLLYDETTVTIAVVADLPGDFNLDGRVDGRDFLTWQRDLGNYGALLPADGDNSGTIDGGDLAVWQANYEVAELSAVNVPEPSCVVLLSFISIGLVGARRCLRVAN